MSARFDAIVFDFDGVLVESTDVKTDAFGALYAHHGADIEREVIAYHLAHAGVSRYRKFKYFHEVLLGIPYTDAEGEHLSAEFSRRVVEVIVRAPYVAGAKEFLDAYRGTTPMFVASGTPDGELKEIVERRGMSPYFISVNGSPETKGQILDRLITQFNFTPPRVLMVGDAQADLDGATHAGTGFVGRVSAGRSPFSTNTITIPDLSHLATQL